MPYKPREVVSALQRAGFLCGGRAAPTSSYATQMDDKPTWPCMRRMFREAPFAPFLSKQTLRKTSSAGCSSYSPSPAIASSYVSNGSAIGKWSAFSSEIESQLITYGAGFSWKRATAKPRPRARVSRGGCRAASGLRTLSLNSPIAFAGVSAKKRPFAGLMLWYSRSRLCSHGSCQVSPSLSRKVLEQPLFRNPIDAADEQLRLGPQRFERERPRLQQPIGLLVAPAAAATARAREIPPGCSSALRVRPSSSSTTAWPVPSCEICRVAITASCRMTSSGRLPSSSSVRMSGGRADLQRAWRRDSCSSRR